MSLAIKKFADGGSPEVRTYKRGNDEVDLNAFVRQAEAGFNDWLDKTDIKEKHKKEVRAAYQDMITRINDDPESFVARLGGGFTNTAGITNKTKGFDAYGVAAGYLGNTLRGMSVYTKPEVKSDKPKYKRDAGFITSKMQSQIWGDSPESFIRLDDDSYDENTGQRGIVNRIAQTVAGLGALKGRLKDYQDFDSDEDYNHAIGRIDSAIEKLQNANPNDDWFTLGQLGMTGMDRFFSTGNQQHPTQPQSPEEQAANSTRRRSQQFEQWVSSTYPRYTGTLHGTVALATSNDLPVSNAALTEFKNKFNSFSNDDLKKWIQEYVSNIDSYDINNNQFMRRIYPSGIPNFNTGQVIATILNRMRENGMLYQFSSNSTKYYIPGTSRQGAGYVWDANPEVNALYHMDIHDIPYWQQRISNEFSQNNPSSRNYAADPYWSQRYPGMYKDGGILKAQGGTTLKIDPPKLPDFNPLGDLYAEQDRRAMQQLYNSSVSPDWVRLQYGTNPNNLDTQGNARVWGAYDVLTGWTGNPHNKRTDKIGTTPQTPTISNAYRMQRNYINSGNMVRDVRTAYQNWLQTNPSGTYQDFVNFYNNKVQAVRDLSQTKFDKGYNNTEFQPLYDDYNWLYQSSAATYDPSKGLLGAESENGLNKVLGSTMFNRNALAFNSDEDAKDLRSGTFIDNDPSNTQFWINNEGKLELRTVQPKQGQVPSDQVDQTKVNLDEQQVQLKDLGLNASLARQGFFEELGTDLLGAGRLAGSIWANNRIARTVRDSLRPKLHDTYELYSPVTGAFGEMQLRNRQGAETLSQSYRPFTSDASLASARMLEGQRQANDLQYQGFLADDREIRRTQAEALQRQEGNIARRSALANENRDAIIANNQAVAQLEASRVKQNWNSIDNYLRGVEGRMRQRLTENRDRRNQFALQTSNASADQFRRDAISKLYDKYRQWQAEKPTDRANLTFTDWATQNTEAYTTAMQDINATVEALKYRGYANTYGLKYDWPTYTDNNGNQQPIGFDINSGKYKWLKSGGSLRLSSSQLIDKIIKKNEGNS